jgi:putative FmdB family regulatory protein
MPFYEYQCEACGAHHEAMQKMSDAPLKKCPACGKPRLKRLISAPLFRLKGGGWYETDFKSEKETKRNLHGEEAKEAKDAGEAKPKDAKPDGAAKPEAKPAESAAAKDAKADVKPAAKPAPKPAARRRPRRATRRR